MPTHVALLRGVNVGGPSRRVAMAELRGVVESLGHKEVATYIQSGNVVFSSTDADAAVLAAALEAVIADRLGVRSPVVVLDRAEFAEVVAANPYSDEPDPKKVHVVFRAAVPNPDEVAAVAAAEERARAKGSRDSVTVRGRAVYLHLPNGMGRSELAVQLARLPTKGVPDGGGTSRNWSTVLKLRAMLDAG
jgi:uncharacterized protein (DUF1697 family)